MELLLLLLLFNGKLETLDGCIGVECAQGVVLNPCAGDACCTSISRIESNNSDSDIFSSTVFECDAGAAGGGAGGADGVVDCGGGAISAGEIQIGGEESCRPENSGDHVQHLAPLPSLATLPMLAVEGDGETSRETPRLYILLLYLDLVSGVLNT